MKTTISSKDHVSNWMSQYVMLAQRNAPFTELCRLFMEFNIHHLPIVDEEGELCGMLSSNDALRAFTYQLPLLRDTDEEVINDQIVVREIMSPDPLTISPEDSMEQVVKLFSEHYIHSLPVVSGGRMVGIITSHDVMRYFAEEKTK
jgi:CBS domain-containing protein